MGGLEGPGRHQPSSSYAGVCCYGEKTGPQLESTGTDHPEAGAGQHLFCSAALYTSLQLSSCRKGRGWSLNATSKLKLKRGKENLQFEDTVKSRRNNFQICRGAEFMTEKRGKESKTAFGGPVVSSLYQEETIREEDKNIFDYCRENNIDYVTKAIRSKKVDVNVTDEEGDNTGIARNLKKKGRALLHWACDRGHKELVSVLLQHAADVNSQGEFCLAMFSLAWERRFSGARGGTECKPCRTAPQLRAPPRLCHGTLGAPRARSSQLAWSETAFVLSCIWWCNASVEEAAEFGSAPGCEDGEGQTALHYAAACEFLDIVELLLNSGADPTLRDQEGCLPEEVTDCKAITSALQQHTAGKT
ncbi:acyl-CoA-binding domain-containing protein 6 isoform X5 [Calonectris borealis]|uniref:acyl-CoA-binding domain-containing protein 6 isoform X5 n=1 Tax=Calonectris borealis TaxID=1323832 RepID=UPI003F4BC81F